jgi:hypothetical protein
MLPNLSSAGPQQQPNPLALYLLALAWALGVAFGLALPDVRLVVRRLLLSSRPLRLDSIELRKDLSGVVLLDDWPPAAAGGSVGGGGRCLQQSTIPRRHGCSHWLGKHLHTHTAHSPQPTAYLPPPGGQAAARRWQAGRPAAPPSPQSLPCRPAPRCPQLERKTSTLRR